MNQYETRVRSMEAEGMTRSDAQSVIDAEDLNGRKAYEADVKRRPYYQDGTPRKTWEQLGELVQWTWRRIEK